MTDRATQPQQPAPLAFVIADLSGGGAQRVATIMLREWARRGRDVRLLTFEGPEGDFFRPPPQVRRIVVGATGRSPHVLAAIAANVSRLVELRRALRATEASTVISFITATNVLVILASRGLGMRVIVSERNDPSRQNPGRLWRLLRWTTYRFADVVTANSRQALRAMKGYVSERKLAVLPNPVELPIWAAGPAAARVVLNVGRLVPQKGQGLLIEAFAAMGASRDGWSLTILGEGPERARLSDMVERHKLAPDVALPGAVDDPSGYYRRAAIFVMPSYYEGTPNALLEAMAAGLPCIVSDQLPGALEHVENGVTGLVFRSGDAGHLGECLIRLSGDGALRARLGQAARGRMRRFSPDRVLEEWDRLVGADGDVRSPPP